MNLFFKLFASAFLYLLFSYCLVDCRISDKRRCADPDCREPISIATTLIRFNSIDERLLSFPPNTKIKIFSKDAGDNPNFWEAEIYGKRGYVPKGLVREDKVLVPPKKLSVVPTGRVDIKNQNATERKVEEKSPIPPVILSETPQLPVANSKGIFNIIGGVSADSVPTNSPDIKPRSTKDFQVIGGTTIYEDITENPTNDAVNKNQESNSSPSDEKETPPASNVPSSDVKPVTEVVDDHGQLRESEQNVKKEAEQPEKKDMDLDTLSEIKESKPSPSNSKEPSSVSNFSTPNLKTGLDDTGQPLKSKLNINTEDEQSIEKESDVENGHERNQPEVGDKGAGVVHTINTFMSNLLSSGTGEGETENEEEELEEEGDKDEVGSAEEVDEGEDSTDIADEISGKESESGLQSEKLVTAIKDNTLENVSKAPSMVNAISNSYSSVSEHNETEAEKDSISRHENIKKEVSKKQTIDSNSDEKAVTESTLNSDLNETTIEVGSDVEKSTSEEKEVNTLLPEAQEIHELKSEESQSQDLLQNESTQLPESKQPKSENTSVFGQSLPAKESSLTSQKEVKHEEKDILLESRENTDMSLDNKTTEAVESQIKTDSGDSQVDNEITKVQEQIDQKKHQFFYGSRKNNAVESEQPNNVVPETQQTSELNDGTIYQSESQNLTSHTESLPDQADSTPVLKPTGSPKYSSVVSRPFKDSDSDNEGVSLSEEEEDFDLQTDLNDESTSSGFTPIPEETLTPNSFLQLQSPKYSAVVSNRIGSVTDGIDSVTLKESSEEIVTETRESSDISTPQIENQEELLEVEELNAEVSSHVEDVPSSPEVINQLECESEEEAALENIEAPLQVPETPSDHSNVVNDMPSEEGIYSWVSTVFEIFKSKEAGHIISGDISSDISAKSESLDHLAASHIAEEACSAEGVGEGTCETIRDAVQKQVTWQDTSFSSDVGPWDLLERVPLEVIVWLIITAVVVLIFSLGHYYIEAHRRDGPLVAVINKLEREVLILRKESSILEDRLQIAQEQLEAWNTSSSENDALIVELKQELEETKAVKAELEEQTALLKDELESVTESGLEMHRLLEESLSSQDGSQVLLSTVENLREKLQRQEDEISGLSHALSSKNAEVEVLQERLAQSAEVARSLEDKVISVTREKDEEALQLRDKHRELIARLEEEMETKALEETRVSTEMSRLRLSMEELQKMLAEKDAELDALKEVVKQLRATDSNEKIEALFDVVGIQAKLKAAVTERDDLREKFLEEEGARRLLEGHMKKITQEVADLKNSFETAEKEKIEALTKLQVLSNYFKEKESQLQKELGLQESMWLQKQSDDHTIYEQMRSLREENEKYKLQNESLKKEIVEQESSFKIQLANTEQKAHENWVASRQAERRLKEVQQEASQLRNRLTMVEKNSANYSLDDKQNISESNGDPSSPPPSLMFPPTSSPPFMMYGPPMPPPGDFVPPPPLMGSPYPSDSRPPPLGRISSPPLDHRFSPPPPLPYPPYEYPHYGHHSPSPPPPLPPHHRNVHKPQPREMSREQKDHVPNYTPEADKSTRRNKR